MNSDNPISPVDKSKKAEKNGYGQECMDRVYVQMETFNVHIMEHPTMQFDKKAEKLAKKISMDMMKLYQYLGSEYL